MKTRTDEALEDALSTAANELLVEMNLEFEGADVEGFSRYVDDPVGFARDILGVTPWSRQEELLRAVGVHARVLVRSGHKCGKSLSCVILALWWVCTRRRGRVILTAPTFRQVKDILWRELRLWYPRLRAQVHGPELPKDPSTGLELSGGRQIVGVSTNQPENLAGISGAELLFIIDEASGFPDELYEVIKGNSAGGAKIIAISNPTRTVGWFYNGFRNGTYDLRPANDNGITPSRWRLLHISSEESPNVVANDNGVPYPGLATRDWVEEMRDEYGPDWEHDAVYLVRVRGEFPTEATDAVVGLGLLNAAHARWNTGGAAAAFGELALGVDVARFGGDESTIAPVRGAYAWPIVAVKGADGPTLANEVARIARAMRRDGERVRVNVDGIGVGASVVDALRVHPDHRAGIFYVIDVNVGSAADDENHVNLRAQVYFGLRDWMKSGGALPPDDDLDSEILAHTYTIDSRSRKQVLEKKKVRAIISRSPDRADAMTLAVYRGKGIAFDYTPAGNDNAESADDWDDDIPMGRTGAL